MIFGIRVAIATLFLIVPVLISSAAQATTLEWTALDPAWDDLDTSGQQVFSNVDGSGVDVTVSYTDNMFDRNSVPDIYTVDNSPSPEIVGTLRFTNDRDAPLLGTAVTISFSEDGFINDLGTVSLSIILRRQENMVVEAFDLAGEAIFATTYGTNTPGLVELDTDGDAAYRSRGLGAQRDSLYGDTFYTYTDSAVRMLRFTNFTTKPGQPEIYKGFSSQGIRNVDFAVVPEPSTAILLGLGLFALVCSVQRRSAWQR